ncbi:TdeIII family type II restriction endonuclease [uncultured Veillonella sp.]|uniref:TdeIII family type II restriction endonuclease n=1 Tax=uncultured Veillonella sp. TaxID=159268 RepID=UPI003209F37B
MLVENEIKKIIIDEFTNLIENIEGDFKKNFKKKSFNFLLSQMDWQIIAHMVFVSSFESKSGFAIENTARRIAQIRYGERNVPSIVNPRDLDYEGRINFNGTGQIVVTDVETDNSNLAGEIAQFRANNMSRQRGEKSSLNHDKINEQLLPLSEKYKNNKNLYSKPVDLAFYNGEEWIICEIKAGGDLDSSNAPSNVEKLLKIYVDMGVSNCKAYFATIYNKDGEGNTWKGAVKKHLEYPSMFLIGKEFWLSILPDGVTFDKFLELYKSALEDIDLNNRINSMINSIEW